MEREDFNTHISEQLNRNLENLFNQVLEMGGLVEQQLNELSKALETGDATLAQSAIVMDKLINREEVEIDRLCAAVLARQQPTASDLRLIVMSIRIAVDLERMGDEAVKIAKLAILNCGESVSCTSMPGYKSLQTLMQASKEMIKKNLDGFSRLDTSDYQAIFEEEELMDKLLKETMDEIKFALAAESDPQQVEAIMNMLFAVRAAERITDHALNIAECIVYLVKGRDIRTMDQEAVQAFLSPAKSE